jgi:hypothetical protein
MNIAIDYDDTYTLAPCMWDDVIAEMRDKGHEVYLVTWRDGNNDEMRNEVLSDVQSIKYENIHFTNLKAKRKYMEDLGIYIDVWIDDNPYAILHDGVENNGQWPYNKRG